MPSLPISIVSQTLYVDNNTCTYDSIKKYFTVHTRRENKTLCVTIKMILPRL